MAGLWTFHILRMSSSQLTFTPSFFSFDLPRQMVDQHHQRCVTLLVAILGASFSMGVGLVLTAKDKSFCIVCEQGITFLLKASVKAMIQSDDYFKSWGQITKLQEKTPHFML